MVVASILAQWDLYKLHGSTDWKYKGGKLTFSDEVSQIEDAAIIFGDSYKLQYRDPFLFFAYQLRQWTLEARIIVAIGYGFGDEHINKIIQQSLDNQEHQEHKILLSVAPVDSGEKTEQAKIQEAIQHNNQDQIVICSCKAIDFFKNHLRLDYLADLMPSLEEDLFPIVSEDE